MARPLSTDCDDPEARPYFVWDQEITYADLRRRLESPDPDERALWMARVMREARYDDVWKLLRLRDVLDLLPRIDRHLGRSRPFWHWLIEGWQDDGLIVDRAPEVDCGVQEQDGIRLHSLREIAANKVCALRALPGGVPADELEGFRRELVARLRRMALPPEG